MKKKVIFLCLSVLLCTSTFAFASLNDIQLLEKNSKKIMNMKFCNATYCPASSLEYKVNRIVNLVDKEIESIQFHPSDYFAIQDRHIEEALVLKQSELLLITNVLANIDNFIEIKTKL